MFLVCFDFNAHYLIERVFVLHVVITCLDVVFIKTCVYICTSSEQHLILICCTSLLICAYYIYMYNLVLMILSFILVLLILVYVLLHIYVILV